MVNSSSGQMAQLHLSNKLQFFIFSTFSFVSIVFVIILYFIKPALLCQARQKTPLCNRAFRLTKQLLAFGEVDFPASDKSSKTQKPPLRMVSAVAQHIAYLIFYLPKIPTRDDNNLTSRAKYLSRFHLCNEFCPITRYSQSG